MNKSTKIVVLRGRELMYTGIFVILGIILILLLILMFFPKSSKEETTAKYNPGIYTSTLTLGDSTLNVEVTVDENHIKQVNLVNIDESITTMYPLLQPTIEDLAQQICDTQSLDNIQLSEDNPYTSQILLNAIEEALKKAVVS